MKIRIGLVVAVGFLLVLGSVVVQEQSGPGGSSAEQPPPREAVQVNPPDSQPGAAATQPDQPVMPRDPRLERRAEPQYPAAPSASGPRWNDGQGNPAVVRRPVAPFVLNPQEEEDLNRTLVAWEQRSSKVERFSCTFFKFEYNAFSQNQQPTSVDNGEIQYAAPDKGLFQVEKPRRLELPNHQERWICDGKAVYEFDFQHQQVRQYKIPPEQQGKSIAEGPLPFIFGAKAGQLKSRYWIRLIPPPAAAKGQVWLEIYPKYQQDAANFRGIDLILSGADLQPFALQVHHPTQQGRTVYQFQKITVNGNRLRQIFEDPFRVDVPRGWQIVSGDIPQAQSSMPQPPAGARSAILGNRQPAFDGRRE